MKPPFAVTLAFREGRRAARRLLLLTASVCAGVAALVSIHSFRDNVMASVREQARGLLGADLVVGSTTAFSPAAERELIALLREAKDARVSRVRTFSAMAYVPGRTGTRLVQVTAIEGDYPFYGRTETAPKGEWERLAQGGGVLVDPALLVALDAKVGDTVALGESRLVIRATVPRMGGDVGVRASLGPRVLMSTEDADRSGLLRFGSRVRHGAYVLLPSSVDAVRLADRHRKALVAERASVRTVTDDQRSLSDTLGRLGRYLGLVALMALLLGGLGVASAVHVFIQRRVETVAVLRCLGASTRQILSAYLLQAGLLGLAGSLAGAALGVLLQELLPRLLQGLLPVNVVVAISWSSVGRGITFGLVTSIVFALLPLLALRDVPPLRALRRDLDPPTPSRRDPARLAVGALLGATVLVMACLEAPTIAQGVIFALVIGLALLLLLGAAAGLTRGVRRLFPGNAPYVVRQGLANLHRPANQTRMIVVALGFGAFLLGTVYLVQDSLLSRLSVDGRSDRPNLALFDIQPDQRKGVEEALRGGGVGFTPPVPIVPMRIASVKGTPVQRVLAASTASPEPGTRSSAWAFRREYRSTYRDTLRETEREVSGTHWAPGAFLTAAPGQTVPVSVEDGLAEELGVTVGDEIVWDVQGVSLSSRVASLRTVDWGRLEANFFVVFPEGPLTRAPQSFLTLSRIEDDAQRASMQRRLVERFPNVTSLDLTQVQRSVEEIVGRVSTAIRFMAFFSLLTGAVVLTGAVASSRAQRLRESVLLKTLGATRRQLMAISCVEYGVLGVLAAVAGLSLSVGASAALVQYVFESPFRVTFVPLLGLLALVAGLTVAVGLSSSAAVFRKPSLELLRSE